MSQELSKHEVTQFAEEMLERIEADQPALGALREGLPYIGGALGGALLLNILFRRLGKIFRLLPAAVLFFFRDPPRAYPKDETYLYAAADGTVVAFDEVV